MGVREIDRASDRVAEAASRGASAYNVGVRLFHHVIAGLALLAALSGPGGAQSPTPPGPTPSDRPFELVEVRGAHPGPTLALVAGVHGGKVSATIALRRFVASLDPAQLHGTVLAVPVANIAGQRAGLAQTHPADGLNLNRVFPGRRDGSATEQIAARLMADLVSRSEYLLDLHGSDGEEAVGRFAYAARPGLDPRIDSLALTLALHWGTTRVVWDQEGPRTLATSRFLQTAAHLSGVPAITVFEAGEERESAAAVSAFEAGLHRLLVGLGMLTRDPIRTSVARHSRRTVLLAPAPGVWRPSVAPEQHVRAGERLGLLQRSSRTDTLVAPVAGVVLHQRLAGSVAPQHSLVILAADPDPRAPDR